MVFGQECAGAREVTVNPTPVFSQNPISSAVAESKRRRLFVSAGSTRRGQESLRAGAGRFVVKLHVVVRGAHGHGGSLLQLVPCAGGLDA